MVNGRDNGDKERRQRIKLSAQLAREQVKAAESKRMLKKIKALEKAEATIKELKRANFARSRTGRLIKLGGRVFRKGVTPAGKSTLQFAGRAGTKLLDQQKRAGPKRRKRKEREDRQFGLVGGFDPNFRFI